METPPSRRSLSGLTFEIPADWRRASESATGLHHRWYTPDDIRVSSVRTAPPPIPCRDVIELRHKVTGTLESDERLVELDVNTVANRQVMTEIRAMTPANERGIVTVAWITVPWAEATLALQIVAREKGVTGMREALVIDRTLGDARAETWFDGAPPGTRRNLSESPEYDADFPDHPLTRTRAIIRAALQTLVLPAESEQWTVVPIIAA